MEKRLFTSESVTEGHPDKICDNISDGILDALMEQDPMSRVACETAITTDYVLIMGEITTKAKVDYEKIARETIREIGYDADEKGFNCDTCRVKVLLDSQSPDIAMGVDKALEARENDMSDEQLEAIGAGDQGMMYGYACDDTEELMPLSISLAHKLSKRLTQVRKEGILPYLYPDGKSQVTVAYNNQGEILGVTDVVISAQHNAEVSVQKLRMDIEEHVIREVIPKELLLPDVKIHINPTGRFVVGGPAGDVGLTGRKIIVDTYGGIARHGGGAFSGKDPTKVDRSAAYMARYAAKNVVAAGFCKKCEINLAYAIGIPQPVSIKIDTFGTEEIPKEIIEDTVNEVFDFSVAGIINSLSLTKVKYKPVAAYGHFGRTDLDLPWERLDKVNILQEKAVARVAEEIYKNR